MKPKKLFSKEIEDTEALYANYFKVGHNAFEFVLAFGQLYTESNDVKFFTRIITNPISAKNLVEVLEKSVTQYEQKHGVIGMQGHDS